MPMGNVVEEFQIGETKFKICDDFCHGKTKADAELILAELAKRLYPILRAQSENTA